ncbi:hypothetical protein chiPu_0007620 [Chiloscyllium punctatum]|uniref:Uncharacterized protein n=1 Tax=Chiloscyllium punctatum TaxID=137246 RepID=A0A401SFP9_CHIPU|nr:hypothetical protein [Chiloscyllium punctatum]
MRWFIPHPAGLFPEKRGRGDTEALLSVCRYFHGESDEGESVVPAFPQSWPFPIGRRDGPYNVSVAVSLDNSLRPGVQSRSPSANTRATLSAPASLTIREVQLTVRNSSGMRTTDAMY